MKKRLTHLLVVLTNFYLLSYLLGLILMISTAFIGTINPLIGIYALVFSLSASIVYEARRERFDFITFGEELISNINKGNILIQSKKFSISRAPIFFLIFITLAISGNILDGLTEGKVYSIGDVFLFGLLTSCLYYGTKNFMITAEFLPIVLVIGGLLLTGFASKHSPRVESTGGYMFNLYLGLSAIWLVTGIVYQRKEVIKNA